MLEIAVKLLMTGALLACGLGITMFGLYIFTGIPVIWRGGLS